VTKPGAAARPKTAQNKFCSLVVETAGTWHDMAIELTQEIARPITTITGTPGKQHFFNAYP